MFGISACKRARRIADLCRLLLLFFVIVYRERWKSWRIDQSA